MGKGMTLAAAACFLSAESSPTRIASPFATVVVTVIGVPGVTVFAHEGVCDAAAPAGGGVAVDVEPPQTAVPDESTTMPDITAPMGWFSGQRTMVSCMSGVKPCATS